MAYGDLVFDPLPHPEIDGKPVLIGMLLRPRKGRSATGDYLLKRYRNAASRVTEIKIVQRAQFTSEDGKKTYEAQNEIWIHLSSPWHGIVFHADDLEEPKVTPRRAARRSGEPTEGSALKA